MLKLKFQYFGHQIWRADSLEKALIVGKIEGRRRRGRQRTRWFDGITNSMDMSLHKHREMVKDRESWHVQLMGLQKSWTQLEWLNNNKLLSLKKWNNIICHNINGPREYHTKWSKSERAWQILYDMTYMYNVKYSTNELIYKTETYPQT